MGKLKGVEDLFEGRHFTPVRALVFSIYSLVDK